MAQRITKPDIQNAHHGGAGLRKLGSAFANLAADDPARGGVYISVTGTGAAQNITNPFGDANVVPCVHVKSDTIGWAINSVGATNISMTIDLGEHVWLYVSRPPEGVTFTL